MQAKLDNFFAKLLDPDRKRPDYGVLYVEQFGEVPTTLDIMPIMLLTKGMVDFESRKKSVIWYATFVVEPGLPDPDLLTPIGMIMATRGEFLKIGWSVPLKSHKKSQTKRLTIIPSVKDGYTINDTKQIPFRLFQKP